MGMGTRRFLALACLVAAAAAAGCASKSYQSSQAVPMRGMVAANTAVEPSVPPNYVIQPGDVLTIRFQYHPDHDQTVTVRPDGGLTLPLVGDVKVVGLTADQLAEDLVRRYSKNLRNPKISVGLKTTSLSRVYVGGEVNRPGFVVYRPGLTAVQAVVEAGGPKFTAALDRVILVKKVDETNYHTATLDLAKAIEKGDTGDALAVAPMDVLFVPKTGIATANVWVTQHLINMNPFRGFFTIPFYP
jgi:protein involved in polysaccharide export with SLBB domain